MGHLIVVRVLMEIIGIFMFIAMAALVLAVSYIFAIIAIAIWFPTKAKPSWLSASRSAGVQLAYPFFKWVAPVWLIIISGYATLLILRYAARLTE